MALSFCNNKLRFRKRTVATDCMPRALTQAARRSNQSFLKEINPEYSLERQLLKLKCQYFGHLMQRTNSLEKTLMLERLKAREEGDNREWDDWIVSPTWWTWVWVGSGCWWWTEKPGLLQSMGSQRVRLDSATEKQKGFFYPLHLLDSFLHSEVMEVNGNLCQSVHTVVLNSLVHFSLHLCILPWHHFLCLIAFKTL